jgi:hypothetical protein
MLTYLLQRTVGAVPEEGQQVGPVVLGIEADLSLMVPLALVVVALEQLMEVLQGKEVGGRTVRVELQPATCTSLHLL